LDDCSAQVFPYNIFTYCSIYRVDLNVQEIKKKLFSGVPNSKLFYIPRHQVTNVATNMLQTVTPDDDHIGRRM
jgi:hypothetical protein